MRTIERSKRLRHGIRQERSGLRASAPLAALLLIASCGDELQPSEGVEARIGELQKNGRTPEQTKCDEKWQACYVDCSVRYPEEAGGLSPDLREGCFDSCGASHDLCVSAAARAGTGHTAAADTGATGALAEQTSGSGRTTPELADTATTASRAQVKSCTLSSDGGLWCCVPISTPPYLKCTYTPPPDTIWTFTSEASVAP